VITKTGTASLTIQSGPSNGTAGTIYYNVRFVNRASRIAYCVWCQSRSQ
jgi:hypothetical protein